jgi:hypothetical protein
MVIMNIFALSNDVYDCAVWHNDKHCIKMILEHSQLVCTSLNLLGCAAPYKSCHMNHPCRLWAGKTRSNFLWICDLTEVLGMEYTYRYGKIHKSMEVIKFARENAHYIPDGALTPFAQAMPDEYKDADPIKAYRNYYIHGKNHLAKWTKREIPYWYKFIN